MTWTEEEPSSFWEARRQVNIHYLENADSLAERDRCEHEFAQRPRTHGRVEAG